MRLWLIWYDWAKALRPACSRQRTFMWLLLVLMAFAVRGDAAGVSSFVRCLGLTELCYDRLLDFFHSKALKLDRLTTLWVNLLLRHPGLLRCHGRLVLVGDGLKVGKTGRQMPGVKKLHQQSPGNTKPTYIMGHSLQALSVLVRGCNSVLAIPLVARIHEGVVMANFDRRTLLDKMVGLLAELGLRQPYYLVADAYYASHKVILPLLRDHQHLVTRVRGNAVAYLPPRPARPGKRGRPRQYGPKFALRELFNDPAAMATMPSMIYGETGVTLRYRVVDLLWRPVGRVVRFVAVVHPTRGSCLLMCTDLGLMADEIIELYGYRFKIELGFKQALRVVGAFGYHFWMAGMRPIQRGGGNQYLHRQTDHYREAVRRKLAAYHRFVQTGLIAQGLLQILGSTVPELVWQDFGSWIRTRRTGVCPSEMVVASALRNQLPRFLADPKNGLILPIFLHDRLDLNRHEGARLAG